MPDGGTALYDAIALAYDQKLAEVRKDRDKIAAIVVLTDGEDTDSGLLLDELLAKVRAESESQGGARLHHRLRGRVGRYMSRASLYEGSPANIRTVFRDISTFF